MGLLRYFRLTNTSRRAYAVQLENAPRCCVNYSSTSEEDTGLRWIDGSEIFRKVFAFANGPNLDPLQIPHGVVGLDAVVTLRGMMKNSVGMGFDGFYPIPYVDDAASGNDLALKIDASDIYIVTTLPGDWSGFSGFVIMEYTKS